MSNFPTAIDTPTNPSGGDFLNSPSHAGEHSEHNAAIVAIETYIGALGASLFANRSAKTTLVDADMLGLNDSAAGNALKKITWANVKASVLSYLLSNLNIAPVYAPQGFLINGKILPTVTSSALTLSLKTLAGNNPSATDPVYVRIGDTLRSVTAALSVTASAATVMMNLDSTYMNANEVDLFILMGYNATDGVTLGFARFPGRRYGDFSATITNEMYAKISTITTATSTDYYEVVGRFAATMSSSGNWSVPTFTALNLIQKPIYTTRRLSYVPTGPTGLTMTGQYRIEDMFVKDWDFKGVATGAVNWSSKPTLPFSVGSSFGHALTDYATDGVGGYIDSGTLNKALGVVPHLGTDTPTTCQPDIVATSAAVTASTPMTWATNDSIWLRVHSYPIN